MGYCFEPLIAQAIRFIDAGPRSGVISSPGAVGSSEVDGTAHYWVLQSCSVSVYTQDTLVEGVNSLCLGS